MGNTPPFTGSFVIDPIHSLFQFSVKHMGVSLFSASFDEVEGKVVADEQGVSVQGAIKVASVSIKQPDFRAHVVEGADFFDAGNHPEITFRADDVTLNADETAEVNGELTIRGVTKPFHAVGTYQPLTEGLGGAERTGVELETTVDRRDWGITWQAPLPKGGDALGYNVKLTLRVELVKEA